jgi:formylglycine-generating enzyme required for sulfatase activity
MEASDLDPPQEFAKKVNQELRARPVVALARPGTFDAAGQWIERVPDAAVTLLPFEAGTPIFLDCLDTVADRYGLDTLQTSMLRDLAGDLPGFLETPFYFGVLARAIKDRILGEGFANSTPLELFQMSIDSRLGAGRFDSLLEIAANRNPSKFHTPIEGIVDDTGFLHDGYRAVALAVGVLLGKIEFEEMARTPNSVPAVRLLLNHIVQKHDIGQATGVVGLLIEHLKRFVLATDGLNDIPYVVYIQALVAAELERIQGGLTDVVISRCSTLVRERATETNNGVPSDLRKKFDSPTLWWDLSDAFSLLGDPRTYIPVGSAAPSGVFTYVENQNVPIGIERMPHRSDLAKPVAPYFPQEVTIGPLWVANFLVATEQFRAFWHAPGRDRYFTATGKQWIEQDENLLREIERSFELTAERCFWKERRESAVIRRSDGSRDPLDVARDRALHPRGRVALWDPTQVDDRYSAKGNPVVGVTWWEAMAFCRWWTANILPTAGFPPGSRADLLTDWEWEGIRRLYYEAAQTPQASRLLRDHAYPAHLRRGDEGEGSSLAQGRARSILRPLHVGVFPVPVGAGPTDMIGNVWEWTRSRVFGTIVPSDEMSTSFGATAWDPVDIFQERLISHEFRERTSDLNDLSFRAVRGGSFFSVDEEASWNPAYRLCDPPYSSYFDLGFRIAIYPPSRQSA